MDLSQVLISTMMVQLQGHNNAPVDENMFRHMALNTIRSLNVKFRGSYGQLVIACDDRYSWRRDVFPLYKAKRKDDKKKSEVDWDTVHRHMNRVKNDLYEFFPYKVIRVPGAEADDVIGVLVAAYAAAEKILIVSGDKDFIQLHTYANVDQYDPTHRGGPRKKDKGLKTTEDPVQFLREHILHGDSGDGIPNVLSDDDALINPDKKQSPLTKKRMEAILSGQCDGDVLARLRRNRTLIDLREIPKTVEDAIIAEYNSQAPGDRSKLMDYMMANRMKHLMETLSDF